VSAEVKLGNHSVSTKEVASTPFGGKGRQKEPRAASRILNLKKRCSEGVGKNKHWGRRRWFNIKRIARSKEKKLINQTSGGKEVKRRRDFFRENLEPTDGGRGGIMESI